MFWSGLRYGSETCQCHC
uniref:Uncharacterized protein n=1 Tax=Serratia marcescens TaxID=615 RepID=A0A9X8YQY9_SERMA